MTLFSALKAIFFLPFIFSFCSASAAPFFSLTVENPVIKAMKVGNAQGKMNTAGYMTLHNVGDQPIRVTGIRFQNAADQFCEFLELHTHAIEGGVARMKKVDAFTIPAHGTLTLAPGKDHVMFMKLKGDVLAHTTFSLVIEGEENGKPMSIPLIFNVLSQEEIMDSSSKSASSKQCACPHKKEV